MSQPTSRHTFAALFGALVVVAAALPAPAAAAAATPAAPLPQKPPSIMRLASDALAKPSAKPAAATATYPVVPALNASPAISKPNREVLGFAQAGGLGASTGVGWNTWNMSLLTTLAYFGLHVNSGDGHLVLTDTGGSVWQSPDVTSMITAAHNAGTRVVLTIVMQGGSGTECTALQHASTTISDTVTQMTARGVDGVNVDYESGNAACAGSDNRTLLRGLVHNLRAAIGTGRHLTVDTYASSANDSTGFFDVPGMAADVNGFFVMAYELDGSPPSSGNYAAAGCSVWCLSPTGPHSGYWQNGGWDDDRVAATYATAVGAGKTILGLPYYGYAACVQSQVENAVPLSPTSAAQWTVPTIAGTQDIASSVTNYHEYRDRRNGVDRWATYQSMGCNREMYLDDAYSIGRKYDLVTAYGLGGTGMWSLDYGGGVAALWNDIASHFTTQPTAPQWVTACAGAGAAYVGWSPAGAGGGPITQYTVTASPAAPGGPVVVNGSTTAATVPGLTPGTSYTFTIQAQNASGPGPVSDRTAAVIPAASAATSYFTWFDRVSPGMNNDNIHLVNPGPGDDAGCVYVGGVAVGSFGMHAGSATFLGFPGAIGGPVAVVTTQGRALAAQRVQYNQSFNEVPASSAAQNTLYFPWYDRASPGMNADNIHVINPGSSAATVQVSGPGPTITLNIPAGGEGIASWPQGTIGGPVKVSSPSVPVIASQRVQYYGAFNETLAHGLQDASQGLVFNWYDTASPGMWNVNIHLVNPQATDVTAQVTVGSAGPQQVRVPAAGTAIVSFPTTIGGPVRVSATGKILASQRVQYYTSFNEVAATPLSSGVAAPTSIWMPWYDDASPGMVGDNVHVVNVDSANTAHVTITGPGATRSFDLAPGAETFTSWPGAIGGPVSVTSTGAPVVASQRVQFYQTFNEAIGLVG